MLWQGILVVIGTYFRGPTGAGCGHGRKTLQGTREKYHAYRLDTQRFSLYPRMGVTAGSPGQAKAQPWDKCIKKIAPLKRGAGLHAS